MHKACMYVIISTQNSVMTPQLQDKINGRLLFILGKELVYSGLVLDTMTHPLHIYILHVGFYSPNILIFHKYRKFS